MYTYIVLCYNHIVRWNRWRFFAACPLAEYQNIKGSNMDEKKNKYKGSSDAQRKAVSKYQKESVDNIAVRVPKGRKEYYKQAAGSAGLSLNQFAIASMDEKIKRDKL